MCSNDSKCETVKIIMGLLYDEGNCLTLFLGAATIREEWGYMRNKKKWATGQCQ